MSTHTAHALADEPISVVVARNIRAEAARRGLTQAQLGEALGISRVGITQRYGFHTKWSLDEVERAASLFRMRTEALLARPEGFEPPTFWFGADEPEVEGVVLSLAEYAAGKDLVAAQSDSPVLGP